MASPREIRKRIGSVKNTSQITRAMKMISAAKLRRGQAALDAIRPYCQKMAQVTSAIAQKSEQEDHALLAVRPVGKIEIVVITSDRGMCGGFNSNLLRKVELQILEWMDQGKKVTVTAVGRKGRDYFRRRKQYTLGDVYTDMFGKGYHKFADELAAKVTAGFLEGAADEVWLGYNYFRSAISQAPTIEKLLPYELEKVDADEMQTMIDFLYEPTKEYILKEVLPRNIDLRVVRSFTESIAAEHGARMTAMDNSTNNAMDMIDRLTLKLNRVRQESITRELMEIIGGAEALK